MTTTLVPRLKDQYNKQIRMKLKEDLGKSNIMEVPQITKIAVSYTHLTLPTTPYV